MVLEIDFENDLVTDALLAQKKIPCVCAVGSAFHISFESPLPNAKGSVGNWDLSMLEERIPAGAGGNCVYHQPALITLSKKDANTYEIIDLDFFCESVGWCVILENGEYAPVGSFWDDDDIL